MIDNLAADGGGKSRGKPSGVRVGLLGRLGVSRRWQRNLTAYWMILPALLLYVVFKVYPIGQGLWISLHRWDGLSDMEWLGLRNYQFVFRDKVFWLALKHTFVFAFAVTIIKNALGLFLAVLLNRKMRGRTFFRAAAFMPVTMAFVVIGVLWSWIYNPTFGLLNNILKSLGLESLIMGWLSDPKIALWSIVTVDVWKWTGFHMVLFLAGLQNIPLELYEAATIDGASRVQSFLKITLPLLAQVTAVSVLMSLMGAFVSNYDVVYVMTGGGPYHSTEVAMTWIVQTGFRFSALGKASAMSFIVFAFIFVVGVIQLATMTRNKKYEM